MVHKAYDGVKYDQYGEVDWSQDMSPLQRKFFELREVHKEIPEEMFIKAFDICWNKHHVNFGSDELDMVLEPMKMDAEMKQTREYAGFDRRE